MSLGDAARAAAMPQLVVAMVASVRGGSGDTADDVFRFLARYYHTRYSRTAALASGAAVPVVVFFFGFIVAVVALSLFMPIVSLIQGMSARPITDSDAQRFCDNNIFALAAPAKTAAGVTSSSTRSWRWRSC
jgi:hypothetical protein